MKEIKIPVSALNKAINLRPLNVEVVNLELANCELDLILFQVIDMRQISKETCVGRDWTAQECMFDENMSLIIDTILYGGGLDGDKPHETGDGRFFATYNGLIVIYGVKDIRLKK
jgi:hypothetical protein